MPCLACARISDRIRSRRGSVSRSTNVIAAATAGCTRAISACSAVAHALHAEIARVHPAVAATMTFVDRDTEPRLERILSEIRAHAKAAARA